MISSLRGNVLAVTGTTAVVEVGGVGLTVTITPQHAITMRVGSEATLRTALIVREDDLSLYGFTDGDELSVFDLLRGVTGVGPKSAMGVLAAMTPAQVASAVANEDDGAFRKVSGIGPKTAKLIVISLAGKVLIAIGAGTGSGVPVTRSSVGDNVLIALVGLGWSERTAAQAVEDALAGSTDEDTLTVPTLLRLALTQLGPQPVIAR